MVFWLIASGDGISSEVIRMRRAEFVALLGRLGVQNASPPTYSCADVIPARFKSCCLGGTAVVGEAAASGRQLGIHCTVIGAVSVNVGLAVNCVPVLMPPGHWEQSRDVTDLRRPRAHGLQCV